ncbi:MAG: Inactive peptidyl-prolyl cis-trans isomerase fkbp6 [Marteilia pararefringens]
MLERDGEIFLSDSPQLHHEILSQFPVSESIGEIREEGEAKNRDTRDEDDDELRQQHLHNEHSIDEDEDEDDDGSVKQDDDDCRFIQFMSFEEISRGMQDLSGDCHPSGSVLKRVIESGSGSCAAEELRLPRVIAYRYKAYLENALHPYDSTEVRKTIQYTQLDDSEEILTIPGLDIALKSMKKFEKSHFIISSDYAYGELGVYPRIPPKSPLFYEITCVNINENVHSEHVTNQLNCDSKISIDSLRQSIEQLKSEAKALEDEQMFRKAINIYFKALNQIDKYRVSNSKESYLINIKFQINIKLLLANCMLKTRRFGQAASLSHEIIKINNRVPLAHEYLARALWSMGKPIPAWNHAQRAYRLNPSESLDSLKSDISKEIYEIKKMTNNSSRSGEQYRSYYRQVDVTQTFMDQCHQWLSVIEKDPLLNQIPSDFSDVRPSEYDYLKNFFGQNGYIVDKIGIPPNSIVYIYRNDLNPNE